MAIENNADVDTIEFLLKSGASIGSAKTYVEEILSHQDEENYTQDEYEMFQEIFELLDSYDVEVKDPGY
jgi:hypothetical protein